MMQNFLIFVVSIFLLVKGATLATKYSVKLATNFRLSKYIIGFIIVAFVSILPEALVSINAALKGMPEFGLGTLFGSNVADLTLIFAILTVYAGRGLKIESKVLKDARFYPFVLMVPILFGLNGYYSRLEGSILILVGLFFYYLVFKNGELSPEDGIKGENKYKNFFLLIFSLLLLIVGSHFTVISASGIAHGLSINPILIAMLVVGLGTTLPELFFSLKSVKKNDDGLAVGDLLGTVLADATILVGLLAVISPFYFPVKIIYIAGVFMLVASFILLKFMRSGKVLSKKEALFLFLFWVVYALTEFFINK